MDFDTHFGDFGAVAAFSKPLHSHVPIGNFNDFYNALTNATNEFEGSNETQLTVSDMFVTGQPIVAEHTNSGIHNLLHVDLTNDDTNADKMSAAFDYFEPAFT